jgi:hypothetical protein
MMQNSNSHTWSSTIRGRAVKNNFLYEYTPKTVGALGRVQLEAENELCDFILDTPIVTNEVPFLLVWIVIPYAFDIHGNNPDAVKETAKQYLSQIQRIRPLPINPSKLNRLIHLIVQRNVVEYQELGGKFFIRPMSIATLRKQCPHFYTEILLMLWLVIIAAEQY